MIEETIPQEGTNNIVPHPWRRYFARLFDLGIYNLIITVVLLYVFRINTGDDSFYRFLEMIAAGILMLFIEPLLLSTLATTPGKWIFGLRLRNENNEKLDYIDGLWRTFYIIKDGYGFNIPIYNIYRLYKSYQACKYNEELSWDEDFTYSLRDDKGIRIVGYILASITLISLTVILALNAQMPINRGNITPEEFYENCNDFMKIQNMNTGMLLSSQGEWYNKDSNNYMLSLGSSKKLDFEISYDNYQIQEIIITHETSEDFVIYSYGNQLFMAFSSFVGADPSVNVFELYSDRNVDYFNNSFSDFEFEIADYKVTNTVVHSGYHGNSNFLFPEENEEQEFSLTMIIERK